MAFYRSVQCADTDLVSVSCKLAHLSIDEVGECLGLQKSQVDDALKRVSVHHQDYNKAHLLLIKWQEVNGDAATQEALIQCMESLSNPHIISGIKGLFRGVDTPPQQETDPNASSAMVKPFASDSHVIHQQETEESLPQAETGTSVQVSNELPGFYQELVTGMPSRYQASTYLKEPGKLELREAVQKLENEFAGLLCFAHNDLKRVGATNVRIFLTQKSVSIKENIPLFEEKMAEIISKVRLEEIILFCSRIEVWDFLNFQLLQDLADYFGAAGLQSRLQEYSTAVSIFKRNTKLVDFLRIWAGRNSLKTLPDSEPVFAKLKAIEWEDYTLEDVARHEQYLASEFRLKQLVMRFSNAGKGCVALMWLVSKSVAAEMKKIMSSAKKPAFDGMTFEELNIAGKSFKVTSDYDSIYQHSIKKPEVFWADRAKEYLQWEQLFDRVAEHDLQSGMKWFSGGKINVSVSCLDRHVAKDPSAVAIIWEKNEPGEQEEITYKELLDQTCQIANVLRNAGVQKGDKVMIYMPMMPLAVAAMLACARMGAVHCVVFSTFGIKVLKERILDTKPKMIITGDEKVQGTESYPLKERVDEALKESGHEVERVFVASRTGKKVPLTPGRDVSLEKMMKGQPTEFEPVAMDSEDDLFIAYTSGTTNRPRRIVHSQAGFVLLAAFTHKFIFDLQPGDIFGCLADLGWVAGHASVVYGPLCNGVTAVLFESVATYPNCERYWEMIDRLKITHFYVIPTVMKFLMKAGDEHVDKYSLSTLKVVGLVGEPLTSGVQEWCYNVVGRKKCLLLDTWSQTEIGNLALIRWFAPEGKKPSHFPSKSSFPFFGVEPVLVEEKPSLTDENVVQGHLLLKKPLPGMGRAANDNYDEFKKIYLTHPQAEGYFNTYDLAKRDAEGNIQVTGRVDDAIRMQGVWLEVPKIETVMDESDDRIQETLLVGYECNETYTYSTKASDNQCTCVFVGLKKGVKKTINTVTEVILNLKEAVMQAFGKDVVPQSFLITDLLPRTLSGKNVRKLLKGIAQDPSMKGKQEVNAAEIRKHCGADFLGVLMQVSDMTRFRTLSF